MNWKREKWRRYKEIGFTSGISKKGWFWGAMGKLENARKNQAIRGYKRYDKYTFRVPQKYLGKASKINDFKAKRGTYYTILNEP